MFDRSHVVNEADPREAMQRQNARTGFFERDEFDVVRAQLPADLTACSRSPTSLAGV